MTQDEDSANKIHLVHLILFLCPDFQIYFDSSTVFYYYFFFFPFPLFFSETSANLKTTSLPQQSGTDGQVWGGHRTLEATGNNTLPFLFFPLSNSGWLNDVFAASGRAKGGGRGAVQGGRCRRGQKQTT